MGNPDTSVSVQLDANVRERAAKVLDTLGLSIPDAVRLLMQWVAEEQKMPIPFKTPNIETKEAIAELEAGRGKRFDNVDALMDDLASGD